MKIFIEKIESVRHLEILYPNLGYIYKDNYNYENAALEGYKSNAIEVVSDVRKADAIMVPHNYKLIKEHSDYFVKIEKIAKRYDKKIILFAIGDVDYKIEGDQYILYKNSMYGSTRRGNEYAVPAFAQDLLEGDLVLRKKRKKPVVGFCGWAGSKSLRNKLSLQISLLIVEMRKLFCWNADLEVLKRGLFFRKKAIEILRGSGVVDSNFIIRKTFSGMKQTVEMDAEKAKEEYIQNILDSDLCLCVKGDGNYSIRFYEALSLGRIPVVLDTDCVWPLDKKINYHEFCLFVDWRDLKRIDSVIERWYEEISEEEFKRMQEKARWVFEEYLKTDSFYAELIKEQFNLEKK